MMNSRRRLHLVSDRGMLSHDTGGGDHPEGPSRLTAIEERLRASRRLREPVITDSVKADWERILAAHEESYLLRFEEAALSGRPSLDHSDNRLCYDTYEAAFLAAGSGMTGIDLVESAQGALPFCAVRPPGHHAERDRAMGFCFLNNAVVAARYWQENHRRERIMVFDWDAHHGNGIQSAFERDETVLYVSIHEHPTFSFPGTGFEEERGTGRGEGTVVNVALPPGAKDDEVLRALDRRVERAVEDFRPEAIIVSAGFDGHAEDDMSDLAYTTDLYRKLGERGARWSRDHCDGRLLLLLEGGYHDRSLAESVEACLVGQGAEPREA